MTTESTPRPEDTRALKAAAACRAVGGSNGRVLSRQLTGLVGGEDMGRLLAVTHQAEAWLDLKGFDEAKHPRKPDGEFARKPGGRRVPSDGGGSIPPMTTKPQRQLNVNRRFDQHEYGKLGDVTVGDRVRFVDDQGRPTGPIMTFVDTTVDDPLWGKDIVILRGPDGENTQVKRQDLVRVLS